MGAVELICLDGQVAYSSNGQEAAIGFDVETSEFPMEACESIGDVVSCGEFYGVEIDGIIVVGIGDGELVERLAEAMVGAAKQRRRSSGWRGRL